MSSKLNILESKKLFKEFNYLMSDIEFKNEFSKENGRLFEMDIRQLLDEDPLFKQLCKEKFGIENKEDEISAVKNYPPSGEASGEVNGEVNYSDSTDVVLFTGNTISHEPTLKTDKDDPKMKHLFRKVTQKTHPDKVFNITDQEISMLRKQNELIKMQQKNFETSHLWLWAHAENLDKKKEIVKHFLLHNAPVVAVLF